MASEASMPQGWESNCIIGLELGLEMPWGDLTHSISREMDLERIRHSMDKY